MAILHLHLLPLSAFVILPSTFLITYIISILLNHVEVDFPYISDTGALSPESNIFGQLLNIGTFIVGMTMYIRYKQIEQYYRDHLSAESVKILKLNYVSLWIGWVATFGMSLVANFQETAVLEVHMLGATMLFAMGNVYIWLQTVMSYYMHPLLNSLRMAKLRLFLSTLASIGFVFTTIFAIISLTHFHGDNKRKWHPKDGGFVPHLISTTSEWITTLAFDFFFLTFAREFQLIYLESPKVHFINPDVDFLPTSNDFYHSEDHVEVTHSHNFGADQSLPRFDPKEQTVTADVH